MRQTNLYGYTFEYVYRGEHYVEVKDEKKLTAAHLCELELNMLHFNEIPSHLPLFVEEIDYNVKLLYSFTGKRRLTELLRFTPPSSTQYFRLLYNIVSTLEQADAYMLNERQYVLTESFIFVDEHYEEVGLIYLPLTTLDKPGIHQEIADLTMSLLEHVTDLSGDGVQMILRAVRRSEITMLQLKQLLQAQIETVSSSETSTQPPISGGGAPSVQSAHTRGERQDAGKNMADDDPSIESPPIAQTDLDEAIASSSPEQPAPAHSSSWQPVANGENPADDTVQTEFEPEQAPSAAADRLARLAPSTYWLGGFALVLVAALLTRIYVAFPGEGMLFIMSGCFILAADGLFMFIMLRRASTPQPVTEPYLSADWLESDPLADDLLLAHEWPDAPTSLPDPVYSTEQTIEEQEQQYYRNTLPEQTTLLRNPEQTTLLGSHDRPPSNATAERVETAGPYAYLEYVTQPHPKRYELERERTVLGRDSSQADIPLEQSGVSRAHCELVRTIRGYELVDLGSSNGTELNGQIIAAYKSYELEDGDRIQLAEHEFVYRIDNK